LSENKPAPCAIAVSRLASSVRVDLRGDANIDAVLAVAAAFDQAHARAISDGCDQVVVDVRHLEFMNSECFKKVLTWIGRVASMGPPPPYRIRFISDARISWQKRSLHALESFAAGIVSVEKK
jgi:hypothetical protein